MSSQLNEATQFLAANCEIMAALVERHTPRMIEPQRPERYFSVLVDSVVGQQLSVKAAATIRARLRVTVSELSPEHILQIPNERLRAAGLSQAKTNSVRGMAEAFHSGEIEPHQLTELSDAEIVATLTQLRGIGPWTAEMFLMFGMARPDVWSPGDLGLRRAVTELFGESVSIEEITERWRPYRTYAALYLWEHADNVPASRGS